MDTPTKVTCFPSHCTKHVMRGVRGVRGVVFLHVHVYLFVTGNGGVCQCGSGSVVQNGICTAGTGNFNMC